jgi:hypothetical protein
MSPCPALSCLRCPRAVTEKRLHEAHSSRCDICSRCDTVTHVATLPDSDALSQEKKRLSETHSKATKTLKAKVGRPNRLMRPCFLTSDADLFLGRRDRPGLQLAALTAQVDDSLAREAQLQERLQVSGIHRFRTCTGTRPRAHSCHICNLTGLAPACPYRTSAPGPGSPLSHLCSGTGAHPCSKRVRTAPARRPSLCGSRPRTRRGLMRRRCTDAVPRGKPCCVGRCVAWGTPSAVFSNLTAKSRASPYG